MTIEEIFNKLADHMREGVMYHDEMAKAYDFLGLWGFSKCHRFHATEEKQGLECLSHYYATHYFKLLEYSEIARPKLVPDSWYKYTTHAVDAGTKRNSVKELMSKWITWEKETKTLYQQMRQELITIGEIAASIKLDNYICDVSKELHNAEKQLLKLESIGYDMEYILTEDNIFHKKYKKKLGW